MNSPISFEAKYFSWHEALLLPSWDMLANPTDEQKREIAFLAIRMDKVREILGCPLRVTSWLRPNVPGRGDYNTHIGGAPGSMHKIGGAVDVIPIGMSVSEAFGRIAPKLEELGLRMESINIPGGKLRDWLHLDTKTVPHGGTRIFHP